MADGLPVIAATTSRQCCSRLTTTTPRTLPSDGKWFHRVSRWLATENTKRTGQHNARVGGKRLMVIDELLELGIRREADPGRATDAMSAVQFHTA